MEQPLESTASTHATRIASNGAIIGDVCAVHYVQEATQRMFCNGAVSSCDFHNVNKS